jgi:hypothetical protein
MCCGRSFPTSRVAFKEERSSPSLCSSGNKRLPGVSRQYRELFQSECQNEGAKMFATSLDDLRLVYPALLAPQRVWSRAEVLASPSPVPKSPGVYAWYFKKVPPLVPTAGALMIGGLTLLYLGISPKAPAQ